MNKSNEPSNMKMLTDSLHQGPPKVFRHLYENDIPKSVGIWKEIVEETKYVLNMALDLAYINPVQYKTGLEQPYADIQAITTTKDGQAWIANIKSEDEQQGKEAALVLLMKTLMRQPGRFYDNLRKESKTKFLLADYANAFAAKH